MKHIQKRELVSCGLGILLGALIAYQLVPHAQHDHHEHGHVHEGEHQITQPDEEYHVHADFLIYIQDQKVDLARDEFMTTSEQELHESMHLHDGNGEVLHIHEPGTTFTEFLNSLTIELTNECVTLDNRYCTNDEEVLALYVNYEPYEGDITKYEPVDDDAILLYYGDFDPEKITTYMNEVKDDACYYSGTCPERGVAPPESCGLTCEL